MIYAYGTEVDCYASQEDEEVLRRRKDEEEDQDVDIMLSDEPTELAPITVNDISDPEKAADLLWMEDDPDDDIQPYFPPVYPEPLEGY